MVRLNGRDSDAETIPPSLSGDLRLKYGSTDKTGWGPQLRASFGYHTPDDWYEAAVFERVSKETVWLDVGCGRSMFPSNPATAGLLGRRCRLLVGLDPSDNITDNPYIHERAKCSVEDFKTERQFDLITLRMVAEHIRDPETVVAALSRLAKPGGAVVIYTISKWAPVSLVSAATPMSVHHAMKRWLWRTDERDTFPIAYKMNTRQALRHLLSTEGFREESFRYL